MKRAISMKMGAFIFINFIFLQAASAQEFAGYRSGNYTGVNGVFFNPANIANSNYRWDVNLVGLNAIVGNNKASFDFKDMGTTLNGDSLKNKIFSPNSGPASGMASVIINGPSAFFNINKKSAMAITMQSRVLVNVVDLDGNLGNQLFTSANNNANLPYTISSSQNMIVNVNAYTTFGLSYASVLVDKRSNFLKGGITVKYLAGAANGYIEVDNLHATINQDLLQNAYITNASGSLVTGFGGVNLSDFKGSDLLKFNSSGFGGDIGFVYEYRPETEKDTFGVSNRLSQDANNYKFRIGLALLNAGSIKYNRDETASGGYDIHIPNGQQFYLSALSNAGLNHIKDTLNQYPQYFTPNASDTSASYQVPLPATLQVDIDYHLYKGFYVNLSGQAALTHNMYNSGYYSMFTVTPRYENKIIGVYIPVAYNSLTSFTAGLALRVGPLYVGSGSILSALFGNSKQADVFVGLHVGILKKDR